MYDLTPGKSPIAPGCTIRVKRGKTPPQTPTNSDRLTDFRRKAAQTSKWNEFQWNFKRV